jgi:hypothetical protein
VAPAAASPLLYFAVVRAVEKAEPRLLQLSPQLTPLVTGRMAKSASISCLQALSRQGSDAAAEAGFAGGLRRDISMSAMSQVGTTPRVSHSTGTMDGSAYLLMLPSFSHKAHAATNFFTALSSDVPVPPPPPKQTCSTTAAVCCPLSWRSARMS